MGTYASATQVSVDKSRSEIEQTLSRYGATAFLYGWDQRGAVVGFQAHDRQIRFVLPLPDRDEKRFTHTPTKREARSPQAAEKEWEQACRQRWRALLLIIKAKLEAVESGITEFEDEFLAHMVIPGGCTVGEWMRPQIEAAYTSGEMPAMLPALGSGDAA